MENYCLRTVENIECVSLGNPGNRTFYIVAENEDSKIKIWVEKELLIALALLLKGPQESNESFNEDDLSEEYSENFNLEAKGMDFSLDLNRDSDIYKISIECARKIEEELYSFKVKIFLEHKIAIMLADQSIRICAAGREKCPLCSLPKNLDGSCDGNPCVKKNGHVRMI